MQGEKVDPDDDQSSKDQSSDQTGRGSSDAVLSGSRSSEFRKSHSKSQHAKTSRRLQVVNMHDQHDVRTVKMEQSKIMKNTVQRKNPINQEKMNQVRCKAKFTAFKPCRNRGRATRVEDVPADTQRQRPTMQKVQNTKVVNSVKISQVQYIDEIVKDPSDRAEAGADDAEQKGSLGYPVYLNRPSPHRGDSR